jgi:hypothetical protein
MKDNSMPGMVFDPSQVIKSYDALITKQLPFAAARALTLTAQDAQAAIRASMPNRFTIRNAWSQRGIIIQPASKNKFPMKSAVMVGDNWSYLFMQESGGEKLPFSSAHLAVPEDVRTSALQILRRTLRPKALLQRKDVFIKNGPGGVQFIMQRLPGDRMKMLYLLTPSGNVKPRLGLAEQAEQIGASRWYVNFTASFEAAAATAI